MLRKSQRNFYHYVKKIDAKAKKWFSYKKNLYGRTERENMLYSGKKAHKKDSILVKNTYFWKIIHVFWRKFEQVVGWT